MFFPRRDLYCGSEISTFNMKKRIALLGSTGSIGKSTLQVVDNLSPEIEVVALAARSQVELLAEQVRRYRPKLVALYDKEAARTFQKLFPTLEVVAGIEGLCQVATHPDVDLVLAAMTGTQGLKPTIQALQANKAVALANKETLVAAGELVTKLARTQGCPLLPVDSEHSAIFQCLQAEDKYSIQRLIITASGGPFLNYTKEQLEQISVAQALNHPTWRMGPKITIDSSTLMNKGLEVIEAHWLFGVPLNKIEVVIHPQSIIHSMVEFCDGSILAQMGEPSMVTPIQYALTYPERKKGLLKPFDFTKARTLNFLPPDYERFRCLKLAMEALKAGKSMPCYLNAANEVLVERFLKGELNWSAIGQKLETLMERHKLQPSDQLETLLAVDQEARVEALSI